MASRKRKQENLVPTVSNGGESESAPTDNLFETDNAAATGPPTATNDVEITSIVTKRLSSDNVENVIEAMLSLEQLTYSKNSDENRETAFRRGVLLAVVQAMRRHASSPKIQHSSILVLENISRCKIDNFKHDIIAVGGLKACLEAMKRYDTNIMLQGRGCLFIGTLWGSDPDVHKKVVEDGGLETIVKAMEENEEDIHVQRCGCFALKVLLLREESSCVQAANDAGCIALVIAAMNNHPGDEDLQQSGCDFLRHLSKAHEDYRTMILDAKGLIPVVEALRIHKDNAAVKLAARKANAVIIA